MEEERLRIVEYMDRKKETEILVDNAKFWMKMEKIACLKAGMEKQEKIKCFIYHFPDFVIQGVIENCTKIMGANIDEYEISGIFHKL